MAEEYTGSNAKNMHDGVSPILVPEGDERKVFQSLWRSLVPPSGKAQTAQGEIIRIAGRVEHEFLDNGCIDDRLTTVLCSCAVAWVKQNPEVLAPLEAEYIR